jgi:hypothetical protein
MSVIYTSKGVMKGWGAHYLSKNTVMLLHIGLFPLPEEALSCTKSVHVTQPTTNICMTRYAGCFKKSFTTLKAYINLFRGLVQCFELS